jgi:Putative transposase
MKPCSSSSGCGSSRQGCTPAGESPAMPVARVGHVERPHRLAGTGGGVKENQTAFSTARGAVALECLAQDANGDLVYTFTHPWSDGTTGIRLSPVELLEKLAALVPLPRVHLVRYGGCLAPHSHLRGAIIPTPRQQGVEEQEDSTASPRWSWARLLKRVFAVDMARCPWCQRGVLRIIAAITQGEVIRQILRHLKLSAAPPPLAPARVHQEAFAWSSA